MFKFTLRSLFLLAFAFGTLPVWYDNLLLPAGAVVIASILICFWEDSADATCSPSFGLFAGGKPGTTRFDLVAMALSLLALVLAVPYCITMAIGGTPTFWYILPPVK